MGRYLWTITLVVLGLLTAALTYQTITKNFLKDQNVLLTANLEACQDDAKITFEVSQDYYTRLDSLTREYHTYRMRQPARCVPVEPTRCNIQTSPGTVRQATGLRIEWLFDLTREADELREQMKLCQDYLKGVMQGVK